MSKSGSKCLFSKRYYNIKYTFNINISDNKNVDDYHIITILSNILKNALKASLTTKNPFVNLEIDNSKNILKIVCANNFNKNKETNLQVKIDNPINFHVGIQNIEDTVNLYNGLYKTEIDDEIYKVIIII